MRQEGVIYPDNDINLNNKNQAALSPLRQLIERWDSKLIFLSFLLLISALGVVYTKYLNRHLHIQLESLQHERDHLHVEWTQLLLEQGTLASDLRVEKIAREKLGMFVPSNKDIMVIQP